MARDWSLRATADELRQRYVHEGLWNDDTLGALIDQRLASNPDLTFRIWSDTRPYEGTIEEVHHIARSLAAGLAQRGIGPGDVVAFQLPNSMEAAAAFWGVSFLGAVIVPIVHFYGAKEVGFILRQSGARALITADRFRQIDYLSSLAGLRAELPDLDLVVVVGQAPADTLAFEEVLNADHQERASVDPDTPALIAYTSGTTADPKGVVHTHRSLLAEIRQLSDLAPPNLRPAIVGAPVGHAIGMLGGLLGPVERGVSIHLIDVWEPPAVLAAMVEADLTFLGGATYFLTSLLDSPDFGTEHLERIPFAGLGGAPVPAAVAERAAALGITLVRSYGSTEHPSITGSWRDAPEAKRLYTDGAALPGVEMRLVDDVGRDVPPGSAGEILSRGPELFAGYTDPELTNEAVDADGWFATGDIGVLDADGYLAITDRKKDIIIRGGENVSAAEVEELLLRMPGVAEVAVVAAPDARLGEHVCAFVRLLPDGPEPSLDDVRDHLRAAGLARQKWPEELRIVEDFPRTPSSKVKKFTLRDQLRHEAAVAPEASR
ncbi:MAG: AMP-binding protein [Acidimicrobiia bacterium]